MLTLLAVTIPVEFIFLGIVHSIGWLELLSLFVGLLLVFVPLLALTLASHSISSRNAPMLMR